MSNQFNVHVLNEQGLRRAKAIAKIFSDALDRLEAEIPAGRERTLVVAKMQEACFFAKRAMALDPANQQPDGT